jgi:predicted DNA binding CopG/RHH family protein
MNSRAVTVRQEPELDLIPVERRRDVPRFANEDEEAAFWATHRFSDSLLSEMKRVEPDDPRFPPARPRTQSRPIAVRFEDDVLKRIRAVAAKKHMGYQTLLKEFVLERLYEEEKREGLIA